LASRLRQHREVHPESKGPPVTGGDIDLQM